MWKQLCEVDSGNWEKEDLTVNLRHVMNFGDGKFEIEILNTGEMFMTWKSFFGKNRPGKIMCRREGMKGKNIK